MATSNLIRWGGLAALAGGVLWVVTDVAFFVLIGDQPESIVGPTSTWVILAGLFLAGGMLVLLGLVGLYTFQAAEGGGRRPNRLLGSFHWHGTGCRCTLGCNFRGANGCRGSTRASGR